MSKVLGFVAKTVCFFGFPLLFYTVFINPPPITDGTLGTDAYFEVTAYCPCSECCGRFADGITASGEAATGFLVAAPKNIPFGTLIAIPGYADGLPVPVLDRGGAIKAERLDLLFPTHQEALEWGRQKLKVKIYEVEK